ERENFWNDYEYIQFSEPSIYYDREVHHGAINFIEFDEATVLDLLKADERVNWAQMSMIIYHESYCLEPSGPVVTVDFEATPLTGTAPLTAQFTDMSSGGASSWSWFFYGTGVANSFEQNPVHTYYEPGVYTVRLVVNGESALVKENYIIVTNETGDEDDTIHSLTYLGNAYPNPFNPETTIVYSLQAAGEVSLEIYNIKGQQIKTLVNEYKTAGSHDVIWNGLDSYGNPISSGIYFYQMKTADYTSVKKLILLK
ncbi:MAG: T9SS type A sorting domain-containing protein, partial [Candidatus Cloacimonetes bacterium]|nr:T9SS type A sorting domain-containing protein [Candidatus Cloacimonadota bacterium]